ncbi:benzoate 4-monooxygenase cytochrome P450 [Paecilomyces variotii No. 5]|uniref:Benzoate 4-monooxygenase cytochrome P450 n=1 Tax=Byssochlamys spectabilis (strain No. 5 / NBRC 109023) TaxID=1356009 RepID=V5HUY3_BYSSN|nr:benzoate 4-monooxygenase cytochrome P450 [Paecilomyces variotii No. 5]
MNGFLLAATLAVGFLFSVWRIYLCPWSRFPGPKLAALSSWYEWYWEVHRKGKLTGHLEELHNLYGPVVRYGPRHIHFNDPSLYKEIYRRNPTYAKDPTFYGTPRYPSTFRETNIEKHSIRRYVLSRSFNAAGIQRRMPMIIDHYDSVMKKLDDLVETGHTTINIFNLSRSLAADVLSNYITGSAFGCINEDDNGFDSMFVRAIQYSSDTYFENRNPFLLWWKRLVKSTRRNLPTGNKMLDEITFSDSLVKYYLSRRNELKEDEDHSVLATLLRSDTRHNFQPLSKPELMAEGRSLLAAGVNTIGFALSATLFYIAWDKEVQTFLQTELGVHESHVSESAPQQTITELPYLNACIKEGYRLSGTVNGRLPRVAGREGVHIGEYFLPEGTVFGMGNNACHMSPKVFEEPEKFMPMRWIDNDESTIQMMSANLHPYGWGPRQCLGEKCVT